MVESVTIDAAAIDASVVREARPLSAPSGAALIQRLRLAVTTSSGEGAVTGPERMIDGNTRTAWNSRTDDLIGAWFEVTVPVGATVRSFGIIGGFANRTPRQDLFLLNHRIERLRVSRGGEQLGECSLDAESAAMQYFSLQSGPGVYRFTVTAVRPGTRAAWREVCVTEFELFGDPPSTLATDAGVDGSTAIVSQRTTVAAEPTAPIALTAAPSVASLQAHCARWRNDARRACAAASNVPVDDNNFGCACRQLRAGRTALPRPTAAFQSAMIIERVIPSYSDPRTSCDLLVNTPAGRFPLRVDRRVRADRGSRRRAHGGTRGVVHARSSERRRRGPAGVEHRVVRVRVSLSARRLLVPQSLGGAVHCGREQRSDLREATRRARALLARQRALRRAVSATNTLSAPRGGDHTRVKRRQRQCSWRVHVAICGRKRAEHCVAVARAPFANVASQQ